MIETQKKAKYVFRIIANKKAVKVIKKKTIYEEASLKSKDVNFR